MPLVPRLRYDPAASEVVLQLDPSDVQPGLEYVMSVLPSITSWDGIPLAEGRSFRVRFTDAPAGPPPEAPSFSRDVLPRLRRSCGLAGCHAASGAALGLDLSSGEGVRRTAIGVIASAWPAVAGDVDRGNIQWSGLHRIAPGAPGESYLLYKVLGVGPVRGARMPRGAAPWTQYDARVVSDWIAAGALTR
jgi:hypothetical protein